MINPNKAFSYFDRNHGPIRTSTNGWYDGTCPYCDSPKLAVSFNYMQVKCWKGCFHKTSVMEFIQKVEQLDYFEVYDFIGSFDSSNMDSWAPVNRVKASEVGLPAGFHSILSGDTSFAMRAQSYLDGRGFDLKYMDKIGIGYCNEHDNNFKENYFGYIIIPFKSNGVLKYFIGRDFIGNSMRYKNPEKGKFGIGKGDLLFNEEALYTQRKVYVAEGWTDASTMGAPGVSIQGNSMSTIQISKVLSAPVGELVIVLDAGYYMQGLHLARKFMDYKKVKVLNMNLIKQHGKDINEVGIDRVHVLEEVTPVLTKQTLYEAFRGSQRSIYSHNKV